MRAGTPPTFAHPIVRTSIYEAMPAAERSHAHAAAAQLLAEEGADPEDVALHLLATEAGAVVDAIDRLRDAAAGARRRGSPESAVAYLERALLDASAADGRAHLFHELAQAQSVLRDPHATDSFRQAMRNTIEPVSRARIAVELVETLMVAREWDAALEEIQRAGETLDSGDAELSAGLEVFRAQIMAYDVRWVDRFETARPRLTDLAARSGRAGRLMAALLAACACARGEPTSAVIAMSKRALHDGRLMAETDAESWGPYAAAPLAWLGDVNGALQAAADMRDAANRRCSVYGFVRASALHALALSERGDLRAVEADVRAAFDVAREGDVMFGLFLLLRWSIDALIERPQLDDAAAVARSIKITPPLDNTYLGA